MSTNYYFRDKNLNKVREGICKIDSPFLSVEKITRMTFGLETIHIGQTAIGWKAVLRTNELYKTVEEMKTFYVKNKDRIEIIDEYKRVLTWEEFEDIVLNREGEERGEFIDDDGFGWNTRDFC